MLFKSAKGEEAVGIKTTPDCHFLSQWRQILM